ncbi:MAG: hypothetical protein KDE53_05985, partial [Caldilineaceae bacterium]|nr:hypothetical protein [Caldilineaceae bacterium]
TAVSNKSKRGMIDALKKHAVAAGALWVRRGIFFAARLDACGDGATKKIHELDGRGRADA